MLIRVLEYVSGEPSRESHQGPARARGGDGYWWWSSGQTVDVSSNFSWPSTYYPVLDVLSSVLVPTKCLPPPNPRVPLPTALPRRRRPKSRSRPRTARPRPSPSPSRTALRRPPASPTRRRTTPSRTSSRRASTPSRSSWYVAARTWGAPPSVLNPSPVRSAGEDRIWEQGRPGG